VVLRLSQLGYLQTIRGKGGGLRLGRPAASIRIGQLVRDTEEDFGLVECFHREGRPCVVEPACLLNDALGEALDAFIGVLDRYTLADLVAPRDRLARLLSIPPATPG
jgi:Rrf2 family nitric oxide-sensitive transcriptional repressor